MRKRRECLASGEFFDVPFVFSGVENPASLRLELDATQARVVLRTPWGRTYEEKFSSLEEARRYYHKYSANLRKAKGVVIEDLFFPRILE